MSGPYVYDRVRELSTTEGTGSFTLAGAVAGYRTFTSVVSTNSFYYCIANEDPYTEWEVGIGTLSGSTLTRSSVLASSNSNALVNFSAGTKNVFITSPAALFQGLLNVTDTRLLGRSAGSNGLFGEITIGTGLSLAGGTLSATGGGGTPGGSNTQVQFNDSGSFGGDSALTWAKTTDTLTLSTADGTVILHSGGGGSMLAASDNAGHSAVLATGAEAFSFTADNVFVSVGADTYLADFINDADGTHVTICELGSANALVALGNFAHSGQYWTNQSSAGSTLGSVVKKWPIYNTSGTLLGYIPIYDSIS